MSADRSRVEQPNERKVRTRRKASTSPAARTGGTPRGSPGVTDGTQNTVTKGTSDQKALKSAEIANKVAWSKKVLTLSCKTLSEEFNRRIKKYADPKLTTICSAKNEEKNRYADVLCLDSTRVKLTGRKPDDDYIHANWVSNPDGSRVICTQGPLAETIEDFWRMVVQNKVIIILMLCQFYEGEDNEKCAQYFPTGVDESKTFGAFKVSNLASLSEPKIEGVACTNLEIVFEKKKFRVRHVLMSSWPDQCAPVTSDKVLDLWKWLKSNTKKEDENVVVHCSAGVGRTATFAAIDIAANKIGQKSSTSMMEVVKEMRSMRYQAVQSYVQYLFMHLIMLDLFVSEKIIDKYDPESKFMKEYKRFANRKITKMAKKEAAMGKTGGKEGGKKISMQEDDAP
ncbi:hypothetical protein PRIPAC_88663 [Pristionchus pacificus]|uniref:Uncharacterized protein n=1 Tax=Pristionchus pacificus TaxID=54126 RepID=A0A2A6CTT7_PRIPA|nr:hypothetical protein PRIPAC_88663 [Pristionchus pacificus]|eukprot:PDM81467.1 hypothetical protein PRIPAC_35343 [Pristionchus pacificus]